MRFFSDIKTQIIQSLDKDYVPFDLSYQTVDIIVQRGDEVLFGRKPNQNQFRFIGGFVDVKDESLEMAAKRELREEAGINLEVSAPIYIGSYRVLDPRQNKRRHQIMTAVFHCKYVFGFPVAGDDLEEVVWVNLTEIHNDGKGWLRAEHYPIFKELRGEGLIKHSKE